MDGRGGAERRRLPLHRHRDTTQTAGRRQAEPGEEAGESERTQPEWQVAGIQPDTAFAVKCPVKIRFGAFDSRPTHTRIRQHFVAQVWVVEWGRFRASWDRPRPRRAGAV